MAFKIEAVHSMRDLRLWHWLETLQLRGWAKSLEGSNHRTDVRSYTVYSQRADLHVQAIALLDAAPECAGSTVQEDHIEYASLLVEAESNGN